MHAPQNSVTQWSGFSLLTTPLKQMQPLGILKKTSNTISMAGSWFPYSIAIVEDTGMNVFDIFEKPRRSQVAVGPASKAWDTAVLSIASSGSGKVESSLPGTDTQGVAVHAGLSGGFERGTGLRVSTVSVRTLESLVLLYEDIEKSRLKTQSLSIQDDLRNGNFYVVTVTLEAEAMEVIEGAESTAVADAGARADVIGIKGVIAVGGADKVAEFASFDDSMSRTIGIKAKRITFNPKTKKYSLGDAANIVFRGETANQSDSDL